MLTESIVKFCLMQIHSQSGNSFFTLSQNQLSKSPPKRRPPTAYVNDRTDVAPQSSFQVEQISKHKVASKKADNGFKVEDVMTRPAKSSENGAVPILGLPHLQTGVVLTYSMYFIIRSCIK